MSTHPAPRIGLHTSIAGSLEKAALKAVELGANCFQIFSSSPRMWRGTMPSASDIRALQRAREKHGLWPLVIHDNYLINLASADPVTRQRSIEAFRGELQRAAAIGAEYLVAHPGSYKNQSVEEALAAFLVALGESASGVDFGNVTLLLENTAGSGSALGSRLEELKALRDCANRVTDLPIGFCIDTCHCLAAGYDIASEKGLAATVAEIDRLLGIGNVPVLHANDSKGALGSHLDRHANIGDGQIGLEGFRRILHHPALREKAFILETPSEDDGGRRDVETLHRLAAA